MQRNVGGLTNVAEEDGQVEQAVERAPDQHAHVHPEVVDLEDLRVGEQQHKDTEELCHGDATEDLHDSREGRGRERRGGEEGRRGGEGRRGEGEGRFC